MAAAQILDGMTGRGGGVCEPLFLGIECGATRSVALLADGRMRLRQRLEAGPANLRLLTEAQMLRHFRAMARKFPRPAALGIGMAGVREGADRARVAGLAARIWPGIPCYANHDLETALAAAELQAAAVRPGRHGNRRPGEGSTTARVIVLSGTGSCCYGRTSAGKTAKVGGWGHVLGDKGSGYEIGLRALKAAVYYYDRDGTWSRLGQAILGRLQFNEPNDLIGWAQSADKRDIAALAVDVFRAWQRGDSIARDVLAGAADSLARDAVSCAKRLVGRRRPVQFVLTGGVLRQQPRFAQRVAREIERAWPRATVTPLQLEGAWGAVTLGRRTFEEHQIQCVQSAQDGVGAQFAERGLQGASMSLVKTGLKRAKTRAPNPNVTTTGEGAISPAPERSETTWTSSLRGVTVTSLSYESRRAGNRAAQPFGLEALQHSPTEQRNPRSMNLDKLAVGKAIQLMLSEEGRVAGAVLAERKHLESAIRRIVAAFRRGGRLIYVGAGTSGRLGVLDASECPPTFRVPREMVQGIVAGGRRALWESVEGAEDDASAGAEAVRFRGVRGRDVVVGIAASGRTPFVWGALVAAKRRGATTMLITFNPHLQIPSGLRPAVVIAPSVGPEVLTGSTRLKAGTATKLILNLLTTLSMVRLGKVLSNLMVDVAPTNSKLRDRAVRIVRDLAGVEAGAARAALEASGWKIAAAWRRLKSP